MHLPVAIMVPASRASDPLKTKSFLILSCVILRAFRAPAFRNFRAAGHLDSFAVDECIGNLASCLVQVAPCGLAGDPEFFCRLFLFEPFEIDEPYQLDLIGLQRDTLSFFRVAAGFVAAGFRAAGYGAPEPWPSPAGAWYLIITVAGQLLLLTDHYKISYDLTFAQGVLKKGIPDTFLNIFSRNPERLLYQVSPDRTVRVGRVSYLFYFDDPVRTEGRRVLVDSLKIPGYDRRTTLF